jgi:hypothetical protein
MINIILGLLFACMAWGSESLIEVEIVPQTVVNLDGTLNQHFATILLNPSHIATYAQHIKVYEIKKIPPLFNFIGKFESKMNMNELKLKSIKESWIRLISTGNYQTFTVKNKKTQKDMIYVFLGYKEHANTTADDLIESFYLKITQA